MARPLKTRDARDTAERLKVYVQIGVPALFLLTAGEFAAGVFTWALFVLNIVFVVILAEGILRFAHGSASWFAKTVFAGGDDGTVNEYSYQESLIVRRQFAEADRSYAELCALDPEDTEVRIRRAELYERHLKDRREAERFYLEARRIGLPLKRDLYVSQCLADIYRSMQRDDRLKFELARLADSFPGSDQGIAARHELDRLIARDRGAAANDSSES